MRVRHQFGAERRSHTRHVRFGRGRVTDDDRKLYARRKRRKRLPVDLFRKCGHESLLAGLMVLAHVCDRSRGYLGETLTATWSFSDDFRDEAGFYIEDKAAHGDVFCDPRMRSHVFDLLTRVIFGIGIREKPHRCGRRITR